MNNLGSWTFDDPDNYSCQKTIALYPNFIQVGDKKVSYEAMLLSVDNIPFNIKKGILNAISALDLDTKNLSKEAELTWLFYRHLDKNRLISDSCKIDSIRTLYFNEDALELKYESKILSQQQLHSFLLYGPTENIHFEKRKSWTDQLLKALKNTPIKAEDCFSLFDYEKIEEKEYKVYESDHFTYSFNIRKGFASYIGEEFMDGFSYHISIENLWYFDRIPDKFQKQLPEIYDNLRNAIVEKRRENWYDLIPNI